VAEVENKNIIEAYEGVDNGQPDRLTIGGPPPSIAWGGRNKEDKQIDTGRKVR